MKGTEIFGQFIGKLINATFGVYYKHYFCLQKSGANATLEYFTEFYPPELKGLNLKYRNS